MTSSGGTVLRWVPRTDGAALQASSRPKSSPEAFSNKLSWESQLIFNLGRGRPDILLPNYGQRHVTRTRIHGFGADQQDQLDGSSTLLLSVTCTKWTGSAISLWLESSPTFTRVRMFLRTICDQTLCLHISFFFFAPFLLPTVLRVRAIVFKCTPLVQFATEVVF